MTRRFVSYPNGSRCAAAARSSARIHPVLDAAILLVVSVCVACAQIIVQLM